MMPEPAVVLSNSGLSDLFTGRGAPGEPHPGSKCRDRKGAVGPLRAKSLEVRVAQGLAKDSWLVAEAIAGVNARRTLPGTRTCARGRKSPDCRMLTDTKGLPSEDLPTF